MLNYEDAMDNAQSSLENAQSSLDNTQDNYDNYTITAPISGTVVTKNVNAGENVSTGNSATTLAVIYDLSELTFEMSVDELDISSVKTGQEVKVTADAFEGQTFQGVVTSVSMEGSYSSGVTNYPVTVTLLENGDLLPSMNVDGEIILDSAEDALVIPADALMRGNQVYVKDDSVTESQGPAPAGFRAVQVETGLINEDYVEILSRLEEGDEVVDQPAHGHGHPHKLDAEPGSQGHRQHHPQAQIHQIRHGKEGHVPGAPQHAVGDHLQADEHIEPAHEPGAGHARLKGHRRAPRPP